MTKSNASRLRKIGGALEAANSICIVGHLRPDGDCVGSQLALALALRQAGRKATVWNQDPVPPRYSFLDPKEILKSPSRARSFDLVVALDCASFERLGSVGQFIGRRGSLVNIDHHPSNTLYGDINWIEPSASSTGEMLVDLFRHMGWKTTKPIADALFVAISTDTGSFQYSCTSASTFSACAQLAEAGADISGISERIYQSVTAPRMRLLKHVYASRRLVCDDKVAYVWLTPEIMRKAGAASADTEGLIDHIRGLDSVVVACTFEDTGDGTVRISLRSKSDAADVNRIAGTFGGGGHVRAAGARLKGTKASVQRKVLAAIRRVMEEVV